VDRTASRPLLRLTSLRWFAALAVFVCHVCTNRVRNGWLTAGGQIGVGFFFVLSGFVLAWSARPGDTACAFYKRRFARIYPATAVSIAAAVGLAWLSVPHMTVSPWVLASFGLVQAWLPLSFKAAHYDGNPVTWSLVSEAFFYALLPILLPVVRRYLRVTLSASIVGAMTVFIVAAKLHTEYVYACPLARLPEFVIGVGMATAMKSGWRPKINPAVAVAALVVGWLLAGDVRSGYSQIKVDLALPGVVAIIALAAAADVAARPGVLTSRPMVYLGELSFCFYLTHQLCLRTLEAFTDSVLLGALGGFPLAVVSAMALHHGVELPMQRVFLRRPRHVTVHEAGPAVPANRRRGRLRRGDELATSEA
jgi:peptidoglycan/LPS O-acetylase OafA/YrhL